MTTRSSKPAARRPKSPGRPPKRGAAKVAIEDSFAKAFKKSRGKLDPRLKLHF